MRKLIIIPSYNEGENILNTLNDINQNSKGYDYVVIDDGSTDQTQAILQSNGHNNICLLSNLGIGGAIQTGYKHAVANGYDIAIQFDGDGQHSAEYLDALSAQVENGAHLAIGTRFMGGEGFKSTAMRRIGIRLFSLAIKILTGQSITDPTSGFRACSREIMTLFAAKYPHDYPEPETIVRLIKSGYNVKEIPVAMKERKQGRSSISILKSPYYMVKVLLSMIFASFSRKYSS